MKDTQYMTAKEKEQVLHHWKCFLGSGCKPTRFTKQLYQHLIMHCGFIAHYNSPGFYEHYFAGEKEETRRFLAMWNGKHQKPAEMWPNDREYGDLNDAMREVGARWCPELLEKLHKREMESDINRARHLLEKHGMKIQGE